MMPQLVKGHKEYLIKLRLPGVEEGMEGPPIPAELRSFLLGEDLGWMTHERPGEGREQAGRKQIGDGAVDVSLAKEGRVGVGQENDLISA